MFGFSWRLVQNWSAVQCSQTADSWLFWCGRREMEPDQMFSPVKTQIQEATTHLKQGQYLCLTANEGPSVLTAALVMKSNRIFSDTFNRTKRFYSKTNKPTDFTLVFVKRLCLTCSSIDHLNDGLHSLCEVSQTQSLIF